MSAAAAQPDAGRTAGVNANAVLAVVALLAARDAGLSQPSAAVLFSPWVDLTLSGASMEAKAVVDVTLTPDGLWRRVSDYAGRRPLDRRAEPVICRSARDRAAADPAWLARGVAGRRDAARRNCCSRRCRGPTRGDPGSPTRLPGLRGTSRRERGCTRPRRRVSAGPLRAGALN